MLSKLQRLQFDWKFRSCYSAFHLLGSSSRLINAKVKIVESTSRSYTCALDFYVHVDPHPEVHFGQLFLLFLSVCNMRTLRGTADVVRFYENVYNRRNWLKRCTFPPFSQTSFLWRCLGTLILVVYEVHYFDAVLWSGILENNCLAVNHQILNAHLSPCTAQWWWNALLHPE